MDTYYIEAAVPAPLLRSFDYKVSASMCQQALLKPGMRVRVPFGRRQLIAVVLQVKDRSDWPASQMKSVIDVLDRQPLLTEPVLKLLAWASDYYHYPIGEVMANALPKKLRLGAAMVLQYTQYYQITAEGLAKLATNDKRSHRQCALLTCVDSAGDALSEQNLREQGFASSLLKKAVEKNWLSAIKQEDQIISAILCEDELTLSSEQATALAPIQAADDFKVFLLQGVTGSGKTEVYLQAIAEVLKRGKQALVLVPEIGLTPQTVSRFERRFAVPIICLHSGMTDTERTQAWLRARLGKASIVIGTRSALFVPMPDLGLIIIDEEHDSSFRQQSGFRYVARDLAVMRASQKGIPIVLGSATPSLASLANVQRQRYQLLRLDQRVAGGQLPQWRILDVRDKALTAGLSEQLIARMQHHLGQGGQVLIFLNRRGYAPVMLCHHCGYSQACKRCDAHMTLHHQPYRLVCHHCGSSSAVSKLCPSCKQSDLATVGVGTEQLHQALQELFPDKVVLRMDRDTARSQQRLNELLDQAHSREADILLGTQMLAKGHHFPALTLVGIIAIDSGLMSADFQAMEQLGQTCYQVAGRAGRESLQGEVVLQTHYPEHEMLQCLVKQGYEPFAQQLLQERKDVRLPPYSYLAKWVVNGRDRAEVMTMAQKIKRLAADIQADAINFFGPMPALMERVNERYYVELVVLSTNRALLHQKLSDIYPKVQKLKWSKQLRWYLQVD